ncbi:MAG: thioesterase family protein [Elainellaceae cyanobacterium]
MPFTYSRTVRFRDTDAAGVVYFANVLSMCHEAYEASLAASGINLNAFFCYPRIAIPITHATVDFMRPSFCGDEQKIYVTPKKLKDSEFEIEYEVFTVERVGKEIPEIQETCVARAFTKHVCIDSAQRARSPLPLEVMKWLSQWSREGEKVFDDLETLL